MKERRVLLAIISTLLIYGLGVWIQHGFFLLPTPLFEWILLLVSLLFFNEYQSDYHSRGWMFLLLALFFSFSREGILTFYTAEQPDTMNLLAAWHEVMHVVFLLFLGAVLALEILRLNLPNWNWLVFGPLVFGLTINGLPYLIPVFGWMTFSLMVHQKFQLKKGGIFWLTAFGLETLKFVFYSL